METNEQELIKALSRIETQIVYLTDALNTHTDKLDKIIPQVTKNSTSIKWLTFGMLALFSLVGILIPVAVDALRALPHGGTAVMYEASTARR